jgi:hypothetical protein
VAPQCTTRVSNRRRCPALRPGCVQAARFGDVSERFPSLVGRSGSPQPLRTRLSPQMGAQRPYAPIWLPARSVLARIIHRPSTSARGGSGWRTARSRAGECVHVRSSCLRAYLPACCVNATPSNQYLYRSAQRGSRLARRVRRRKDARKHGRTLQLAPHTSQRTTPTSIHGFSGAVRTGWARVNRRGTQSGSATPLRTSPPHKAHNEIE